MVLDRSFVLRGRDRPGSARVMGRRLERFPLTPAQTRGKINVPFGADCAPVFIEIGDLVSHISEEPRWCSSLMGREMNDFNQTYNRGEGVVVGSGDMARDEGLRKFMLGVYNKMALGLIWSALLAFVVGTWAPATQAVFGTPLLYVVQWGPLALLVGSMFFMRNPSPLGANVLYWSVVTLIGAGLGVWVMIAGARTGMVDATGATLNIGFGTIALAFVMTASIFGGISLWGYTTKRNITGWGSAIFGMIWGVVILSLVNFALMAFGVYETVNPIFYIGLQVVVLALMVGLIAWQTQSLKVSYYEFAHDGRAISVMTTFGALNFYIAFVNIFQIILSLLGRE